MNNYVFVHVPSLINTNRIFKNIVERINSTYKFYDRIFLCVDDESYESVKESAEALNDYEFVFVDHKDKFEYSTLNYIYEKSQEEDFYCLYLHLKGSSKDSEEEILNAEAWADYMMFGVIDNASVCIHHLDSGADLVGSQWHWHFKGNFWWGKASHLRLMPSPLEIGEERFNAEYWCCLGYWWNGVKKPLIKNLFYLPDTKSDMMYLDYSKIIDYHKISLNNKFIFIDKRIDPDQQHTLSEFFNLDYKCALDEAYVLHQDYQLFVFLKNFLNYDATVTVLYDGENGDFKEFKYQEFIEEYQL